MNYISNPIFDSSETSPNTPPIKKDKKDKTIFSESSQKNIIALNTIFLVEKISKDIFATGN
jgi:hypothetical protein